MRYAQKQPVCHTGAFHFNTRADISIRALAIIKSQCFEYLLLVSMVEGEPEMWPSTSLPHIATYQAEPELIV